MQYRYFKAAVLEEIKKPFVIRTLELPEHLSVGQVLVRIKFSGICGAQLGEQDGVKGPDKFLPHTVGHEGGGIVVATGPGVRHVKIHDHVVIHWRKGNGIDAQFPVYRCMELGQEVGGGANNTWQEMAIISENRLTKIPKEIPLDEAALLGCAVTTGLGVITREAQVRIGESVIVYGCGGVGLNVIQGAALAGAYPIVGVDIAEKKLQSAVVMGATHVFTADTLPAERYDLAVDTTGNPDVMKRAWECADRVCLVAQLRHDKFLPLQTLPMHAGRTIFGSDGGGTQPSVDIPRYVKLLKSGRLNLRGLIDYRVNLASVNGAIQMIREGKVGRVVIDI